jgi:hypothetical protein
LSSSQSDLIGNIRLETQGFLSPCFHYPVLKHYYYNTKELEEAEIELELIEREKAVPKFVGHAQDIVVPADVSSCKINEY